jgi:hypothetical protein
MRADHFIIRSVIIHFFSLKKDSSIILQITTT